MNSKTNRRSARYLAEAAVIAAMYAAITAIQQLILPGSATLTVQFRLAEALSMLCIFMPSAIPGLTVGCLLANLLASASAIPIDVILGTAATLLSCFAVRHTRHVLLKGLPVLSALMPALINGIVIGLELEIFFIEGEFELTGFLLQFLCVAAGEAAVCLLLGFPLVKYVSRVTHLN